MPKPGVDLASSLKNLLTKSQSKSKHGVTDACDFVEGLLLNSERVEHMN
jgi:hypothetical protein